VQSSGWVTLGRLVCDYKTHMERLLVAYTMRFFFTIACGRVHSMSCALALTAHSLAMQ